MKFDNAAWFRRGIQNGVPIALGYLAVSFTLGIAARNAGLTAWQGAAASVTTVASAGEYAGRSRIHRDGDYDVRHQRAVFIDVLLPEPKARAGSAARAPSAHRLGHYR